MSLSLLPKLVFRTARGFSSSAALFRKKAKAADIEDLLTDFFEDLRKDRIAQQQQQDKQDIGDNPVSELIDKFSARIDEQKEPLKMAKEARLNILKEGKDEFALMINDVDTVYELKMALKKLVDENADKPNSLLLAMAISQCRKLRMPGMAYALLNFITRRSKSESVMWNDINVYNELINMDWEMYQDIDIIKPRVVELVRSGLQANTSTLAIMEKAKDDWEGQEVPAQHQEWFLEKHTGIMRLLVSNGVNEA